MTSHHGKFRNPMDENSIRERIHPYALAVSAAGHQSGFTVDPLAHKIRERLPKFLAELAAEVERENEAEGRS